MNSSEYKLTNWCNDYANFIPGEKFTGIFESDYNVIYGFGYVKVIEETDELEKNMDIFVPIEDDVKIQKISIHNKTNEQKKVHIGYLLDMVLGVAKEMTSSYVLCRKVEDRLEFKNSYSKYFSNIISYLKVNTLGNDMDVEYDEDNYKVEIDIKVPANAKIEFAVLFGSDIEYANINTVINKYSNLDMVNNEYDSTIEYWRKKVIRHFNTGDKYIDIMANGWLLYQTIVSRLFSRTGFYQAGGAFGFRDQLQDAMALIRTWPEFTRKQILKHASKQFERGDVLHWWHEHSGAGIKTYFSDDYLWLPYVTAEYINITGDASILNEKVPFLKDVDMDGRREIYDVFERSDYMGNVYEHCVRAIRYGLSRKGMHRTT